MKPGHNQQVVLRLFEAIAANDRDRVLSFFSDESVMHSMPLEPAIGQEAIWALLGQVHERAEEIDWAVHQIAESDSGRVLTERTIRYLIEGRWRELPVMGVLDVRGCKIAHWRDYFDLQQGREAVAG